MRPTSGGTIILHPPGVLLYHSHALFFRQAKNRAVNALPNLRAKPNLQRFVLCQRIPNRLRHLFLIAVAEQPLFIRRLPQQFGDVHLPHQRTGQLVQRRTADEHGNQPNCRADDQPHRAGRNQRDPAAAAEVRRFYLRTGDFVTGKVRPQRDGDKYSAMLYITEVNGCPADSVASRPAFDALTPCYPHEHITLEVEGGSSEFLDMRLIDLVAPIGFGQRGLIHCPPAVDKARLLSSIANAASICHPDAVVMTLLLGGTPEDATLYRDHTHGEVIASTFDQTPENHLRITDMVLERAERLVEMKKNVILLVDSLTYLSKVYTTAAVQQGRQTIGMVNPVSLQKAKKLFGAARCLREGGSLTIFAAMNIETGSRVDDSIAEDLKGTANMELVLDTAAARAGIYPPVNLLLSGTKRAELIASKEQLDGIKLIHEMLGSLRAVDMIPQLLSMLEKTTNNEDLLVRIKDWAALMKQ